MRGILCNQQFHETKDEQIAQLKEDLRKFLQLMLHMVIERLEEVQIPEIRARENVYGPLWD